MKEKDIIDAYVRIRTIDHTIPDDVLDFMKNAAIEALRPNPVAPKQNWVPIEKEPMPLETDILVKHQYGVEAIHFFGATWRYWYTNEEVRKDVMASATHWYKP